MTLFQQKAPVIMRDLMRAFSLDAESAAAIVGNLGHESGGFRFLQEKKPMIPGSRGGWGWAQWTGPRRRAFEAWVAAKGFDPASDEANLGFLIHELQSSEKSAIPAVKRAGSLEAKVKAFEMAFERAGVKHYPSRNAYAGQALAAFTGAPVTVEAPIPPLRPKPAPKPRQWAEDGLATFEVEAIQRRLRELGFWQVGKVDGKIGPSFRGALMALQTTAGITQDGHWGPQTKAALADDKNRRKVDPHRANTTASDLRQQGSVIAIEGNRITWASVLGLLVALVGAAYSAWQAPTELPFGSSVALAFLPPWVAAVAPFLLTFVPLAYAALASQGIVKARVVAERTGLHNGEPDPSPSPPLTVPSDTPSPGSLFGSLFGGR